MTKIDEWTPVLPKKGERSKQPDSAAKPLAGSAPDLVGAIYSRLTSMEPRPPNAVHFYLGEGLRWIRVGFHGDEPIKPSKVRDVGQIIESCIEKQGPLFFHALRPYDMLFFLEGGAAESESIGMPASYFGAPLQEVLHAWGFNPSAASRKTGPHRAQRRVS